MKQSLNITIKDIIPALIKKKFVSYLVSTKAMQLVRQEINYWTSQMGLFDNIKQNNIIQNNKFSNLKKLIKYNIL